MNPDKTNAGEPEVKEKLYQFIDWDKYCKAAAEANNSESFDLGFAKDMFKSDLDYLFEEYAAIKLAAKQKELDEVKAELELKRKQYFKEIQDMGTIADEAQNNYVNANAKATALEADNKRLVALFHMNEPWPLTDILKQLIFATDKLLGEKGYDGNNHEELNECSRLAKQLLPEITETLKSHADNKEGR